MFPFGMVNRLRRCVYFLGNFLESLVLFKSHFVFECQNLHQPEICVVFGRIFLGGKFSVFERKWPKTVFGDALNETRFKIPVTLFFKVSI